MCHYPGTDCHQSSTIPSWPMCVTIQVQTATSHQPFHPGLCVSVTIQGQTVTSHQPFHPGLCVSLSRGRLPPVINHSTLAYVCHYPGADCHQSSTIPPWPIDVCHYPGADCHQSSTIPPWPMCVTIQGCLSEPLSCIKFVVDWQITTEVFHNQCRALKFVRRCH